MEQTLLRIFQTELRVNVGECLAAIEFLAYLVGQGLQLQHPFPQVWVVVIEMAQFFSFGVSVAVFLYDGNSLTETVNRLLAPYDEALPVKKELSKTKAEIIQSQREILRRDYKEEYSAWRKNPKAYEAEHPNPHHLGYQSIRIRIILDT